MAITAELHDGTRLEFPDGTDPAVIRGTVQKVLAGRQPQQQVSQTVGGSLRDIPRQVGLTARAGAKAVMAVPGIIVDAGTGVLNSAADLVAGKGNGPRFPLASVSLDNALNKIGLPEPRNADERVVQDAATMVGGAGALARTASNAAPLVTGTARNVLNILAARPGLQMAGAAAAGGAGGSVREAGGSEGEQFAAALAGGLAGGAGANALTNAAGTATRAVRSALTPRTVELQSAEQQINLVLQRSGVDWSQVPERIKQGMRADVAAALNTGQPLNADAVRRLLVFRRADTTPTVGQLTQDPGQITREMNLAKAGANSMDPGLQRLPQLQNQNVQSLLRQLDDAGASRAPNAQDAGRAAIESLDSLAARERSSISALYNAARDTSGRSLPLEGGTFTRTANQLLDEANVGSFLPKDIANKMNDIAGGKYPLTVNVAEQLKTSIGSLQRNSADGNVRHALRLVRQALDDAPLQNDRLYNPGNVPAAPGMVPPSTAAAGEESIAAFNAARSANRAWMQRVEANPALRAVVEGVEPDQFVQRYLVGKGATAADVRRLRGELDPQATEALKTYLIRHLRDSATNSTDDIAKFSGASFRKALRDIGDEKLATFFTREEMQHLRDLGDAAKYMQSQPAGSAVNNSNSGALLIGKGLDILQSVGQKLPLGLNDTISGTIQGMQQRQVMAPRNALSLPAPNQVGQQPLSVNPLLAGAIVAPPDERKKYRGN